MKILRTELVRCDPRGPCWYPPQVEVDVMGLRGITLQYIVTFTRKGDIAYGNRVSPGDEFFETAARIPGEVRQAALAAYEESFNH